MTSDLDKQFKEAFEKASATEQSSFPPDILLRLYAYYKQATKGDNFSFNAIEQDYRSAFKFNAWIQLKGMSEEEAKKEYIKLVNSILK
ncbi:acyl-CoA-binding protein [Tenacibaculum sp. IB213877]|jgi:diazepam-binding inhibitor (GABA receptor modulating acyl-CoA-binding protein)|uniref:acyl-CoA-binding protein n=1 Tax=Tenacibaculum sp. IB213877 TaxID=3097351 RepID=UPI002A5AF016|nr:acyl-CoA-binding protein [Tenacibaculum sp. IB213877]MDY0781126.1 acyl-CoA-binding protein [Tenacibaculum sp. IB213877]